MNLPYHAYEIEKDHIRSMKEHKNQERRNQERLANMARANTNYIVKITHACQQIIKRGIASRQQESPISEFI